MPINLWWAVDFLPCPGPKFSLFFLYYMFRAELLRGHCSDSSWPRGEDWRVHHLLLHVRGGHLAHRAAGYLQSERVSAQLEWPRAIQRSQQPPKPSPRQLRSCPAQWLWAHTGCQESSIIGGLHLSWLFVTAHDYMTSDCQIACSTGGLASLGQRPRARPHSATFLMLWHSWHKVSRKSAMFMIVIHSKGHGNRFSYITTYKLCIQIYNL